MRMILLGGDGGGGDMYLIIIWSGAGMAAVVTSQTRSATVGDSLQYKVKPHQQIILEEEKTGKKQ